MALTVVSVRPVEYAEPIESSDAKPRQSGQMSLSSSLRVPKTPSTSPTFRPSAPGPLFSTLPFH